ncbi:hypothetical protein F511_43232 [Dorcoceras hygrometricum]|uniref:Uncharacterized protein n=1 Tax=Dorcoceras hygrometricum TaxID=472368 RepID=A0A2Z7AX66_9LAMI|nr:hypothetical protein F511_43232 [Dorcoceras hygrometricum]
MGSNPSTESNYKSAISSKNKMQMLCMICWTTTKDSNRTGSQRTAQLNLQQMVATGCVPIVVASHSPGHNTRIPDASNNSTCCCPTYELCQHHQSPKTSRNTTTSRRKEPTADFSHNAKHISRLVPVAASKHSVSNNPNDVAPLTSSYPVAASHQIPVANYSAQPVARYETQPVARYAYVTNSSKRHRTTPRRNLIQKALRSGYTLTTTHSANTAEKSAYVSKSGPNTTTRYRRVDQR